MTTVSTPIPSLPGIERSDGNHMLGSAVISDELAPTDTSHSSKNMRIPNLVIIGASRSGTTSIHYALAEHPQIYMSPNKETNFFSYYCHGGQTPPCVREEEVSNVDKRSIKTLDEYQHLFRGVTDELVVGETSPSYLLTEGVPQAIKQLAPDAKILVVLRQPIEKAYSHFTRKRQIGLYPFDSNFTAALEQDEVRIEGQGRGLPFLAYARYHDYLKRYYDVFDRDRIKVCLFDDLEANPRDFYVDLFRFLGVDESFRPDVETKLNQSGQTATDPLARLGAIATPIRHQLKKRLPPALAMKLWRTWHRMRAARIERAPSLAPEMRRELTVKYFKDELGRVEELVGRDLSHWLT